jgi:hypothetical protein
MANYQKDVFINCPFDEQYKPISDAITFAIFDSGFRPRIALEENDTATERHSKIVRLIRECKYGIHDISRVETDAGSGLPRLNMAYECGLFYGAKHFGSKEQKTKQILVLDSEQYRFQKILSDISGKDACSHDNDPFKAIGLVRGFLSSKENGMLPGEALMKKRYKDFQEALPTVASNMFCTVEEIRSLSYWREFVEAAYAWVYNHR